MGVLGPLDPVLLGVAGAHLLLGVVCAVALLIDAPRVLGVHPAAKPLKFAVSIAVYLATMAVLVPALDVGPVAQRVVALLLAGTMIAEMVPIAVQPLRGTTSHFNVQGSSNARAWRVMVLAIVVATATMLLVALVATFRPLVGADGAPLDPVLTAAWRAGSWLFLLAAVSGFAMAGRRQHSVGGPDGGPGLPVVDWSTRHGDLRVSHFLSMHALQVLPLTAVALAWTTWSLLVRGTVLGAVTLALAVVSVWTLRQALAGRPLLRRPAPVL
ncbi:MAG: hypothetical protein JJT89_15400 [Nitriliruptoraceae bacterium]|nr:hypothetical protein [Nitriliruptoraceae bacterium]